MKSETLLIVGALAVGLFYLSKQQQATATPVPTSPASGGIFGQIGGIVPVLTTASANTAGVLPQTYQDQSAQVLNYVKAGTQALSSVGDIYNTVSSWFKTSDNSTGVDANPVTTPPKTWNDNFVV